MRIAYVNSKGKTFELTNNRKIKIMDADFHKYSYGYESTDLTFGIDLKRFKKEAYTYPAKLYFHGSASNRARQMDELHDAAAFDRENKKAGKLIREDWYIECYIIEGDAYANEEQSNVTVKDISFLCPYPFWIQEHKIQLFSNGGEKSTSGLDFPFDFPFDFAPRQSGVVTREIDHYASSHFKMRFYGPCVDPIVKINGYPYQIFATLKSGEYLEIDSRNHFVTKYTEDGSTENLYNSRSFKYSVFEKIPSGVLRFVWDGSFGIDLTLYLERSVPKW